MTHTPFVALYVLLAIAPVARAEEFPQGGGASIDEFEQGFSEEKGVSKAEKESVESDRLKIGGHYRFEVDYYRLPESGTSNWVQNPHTIWLYFDSRLKGDTRLFLKGKGVYDPAVNESSASPLTGVSLRKSSASVDELKVQFQVEKKVFVTAGVQKIKWGTGQFWNPTDFLNTEARDFLQTEDIRSGIGLIKVHVPVNAMNFYLIGNFDNATTNQSVGAALRAEVPFSSGEFSLTRYQRSGSMPLSGLDLSVGIGDFDVIAEGALSDDGTTRTAVGGVSYQHQYSDDDSLIVSLEGYWNEKGATSSASYGSLLAAGRWIPFHVGKAYELLSLTLPKPGQWNQSTFQLFAIRNHFDESMYYRTAYTWTGLNDVTLGANVGVRSGATGTEMRLGGMDLDFGLLATVAF